MSAEPASEAIRRRADEAAFPLAPTGDAIVENHSVTIREHFAACALQGLLADPNVKGLDDTAQMAVGFADALLAALEQES